MKKVVATGLALATFAVCTTALAGPYNPPKHWKDLSWWGKSGATPAPVKDAKINAYWWWPTKPVSNANDKELWGNRGKVLHNVIVAEKPKPPAPPVEKIPTKTKVTIPLFKSILFDYNKSFLLPQGKEVVDKAVAFMKANPGATATVTGHASNEGTTAYNKSLGQRRADAVRNYMIQQGIAPTRITAVSKGESEPAVPNTTEANRKLNRRAVINIALPNQPTK